MTDTEYRSALPSGYTLHWYELVSVLGQGGFGITYLARDTNLHKLVAIKEFLPRQLALRERDSTVQPLTGKQGDTYRQGLARFIREAQTLASFKHPNIVAVHSFFEANNTAYMVMEYERGMSLEEFIKHKRFRDEVSLLTVMLPILDGLEQVHAAGFIHRDIKPANVFLREDGVPVLIDFGSARQALVGTHPLTSLITPGFAPIEQYQESDESEGPWSDVYALGATFYRLITGTNPVNAVARSIDLLKRGEDPFVPLMGRLLPGFSEPFLEAVDAALGLDPGARPQTVAQWRRTLVHAVGHGTAALDNGGFTMVPPRANTDEIAVRIGHPDGVSPTIEEATTEHLYEDGIQTEPARRLTRATDVGAALRGDDDLARDLDTTPLEYEATPDTQPFERRRSREYDARWNDGRDTQWARGAGWWFFAGGVVCVAALLAFIVLVDPLGLRAPALNVAAEKAAVQRAAEELAAVAERAAAAERAAQAAAARAAEVAALERERARREAERLAAAQAAAAQAAAEQAAAEKAAAERAAAERAAAEKAAAEQAAAARAAAAQAAAEKAAAEKAAAERAARLAAERAAAEKAAAERAAAEQAAAERAAAEALRRAKLEQTMAAAAVRVAPLRSRDARPDVEVVSERVDEFKRAFEGRDIERLARVAALSEEKRLFIEQIFASYSDIEIAISDLALLARQGSASARATVTRLRDSSGNQVVPGAWRELRLVMRKHDGEWQKLEW